MDKKVVIKIITDKFGNNNNKKISLLRRNSYFTAELLEDGIKVDNLGNSRFLPWEVFTETVNLLERSGGIVQKGDAMNYSLGEKDLGLNTIEGYIASKVYKKKIGDKVFRRITPIVNILIWAGICENLPRKLKLKDF